MEFRVVFILTLLSSVLGTEQNKTQLEEITEWIKAAVCSEATPMSNFDMDSALGTWYEYKSYNKLIHESKDECQVQTIEKKSETEYEVVQSSRNSNGTKASTMTLSLKDPTQSPPIGHLFSSMESDDTDDPDDLKGIDEIVVAMDSKNYLISWNCMSFVLFKMEGVSVLTRTRTISQELEDEIDNIIREKIPVDLAKIKKNNQENCED